MATNPAVSLPDAGTVRAALEKCPFVVVSDVIAQTDTGAYADVRLPSRRLGREGRHCHQLCPHDQPPAPVPAPAWRSPARLVDHERGGRAHGWASAFSYDTPPTSGANTPA
jgi:assimilatory nitrate reductase catalytic subunit